MGGICGSLVLWFFVLRSLFSVLDDGILMDRDSWKNLSGSLFFLLGVGRRKKILRLKKSNQLLGYDTDTAETNQRSGLVLHI